jgi:hypothetical protein
MSDTEGDTTMIDEEAVHEQKMMYGSGPLTQQELNDKYPNRPINHSKTLPFSDLYLTLFHPLQARTGRHQAPLFTTDANKALQPKHQMRFAEISSSASSLVGEKRLAMTSTRLSD